MFACFLTLDDCVDRSCVCQLSLNEYMMMMMMMQNISGRKPTDVSEEVQTRQSANAFTCMSHCCSPTFNQNSNNQINATWRPGWITEEEAIRSCRAIIVNTSFIGQSCVESIGNEQSSENIVQACVNDVQVLLVQKSAFNYRPLQMAKNRFSLTPGLHDKAGSTSARRSFVVRS